jgi:hypothetical protein
MPIKSAKNKTMKRRTTTKRKTMKRKTVKSYKPTAFFNRQMTKYNNINAEKKIMTMNNYLNGNGTLYLQDIDAVALPNAGLDTASLSCVVLQTGRQLTTGNSSLPAGMVKLMDGYSNINGTLPARLIGQYAKITSSYLNINITMDPKLSTTGDAGLAASLPHQFRLIQVKARLDKMTQNALQVANVGVPSIATNLFRNESGNAAGINSEIATQDAFTWFINKQFWTVLKDERFTLATPYLNNENNSSYGPNVSSHKSSRFKKYWLPKPKNKVIFRSNTVDGVARNEIVDYNYVVHTIILCKNTSSGERPSTHWSVQANGATAFIDE